MSAPTIPHILRVLTLQCGGLEPSTEHGFFPGTAEGLQDAIKCAEAHIVDYDPTRIEVIPLGAAFPRNGQLVVLWEKTAPETHIEGEESCCNEPQVRGGQCVNCGTWTTMGSNLPQGDNEG